MVTKKLAYYGIFSYCANLLAFSNMQMHVKYIVCRKEHIYMYRSNFLEWLDLIYMLNETVQNMWIMYTYK
jgi:hypothetical protein